MSLRIDRVQDRLQELEVDALLLTRLPDIRWACGFSGSNAALLVGSAEAHFITDGRYTDQAREEVGGADIHVTRNGLMSYLQDNDLLVSFEHIGVQADHLTVSQYERLREEHPETTWQPSVHALTDLVASKDEGEVDRIRGAQAITESVFDEVVDLLAPGLTEREVAAEITYRHLQHGADAMAFPPIVASGPNGAQPHARPTDRVLREGELVVLDMGCFRNGYASDMTRTVAIGEPSPEAREGYKVVRKAQARALDAAEAGMTGRELDAVARTTIENAGLGDYFSHGLGHGIGLQVHEWPRVSHSVDDELPVGCCVTIEPGVYRPDQGFGVRIEDIVVLKEGNSENLTHTPKDLRSI